MGSAASGSERGHERELKLGIPDEAALRALVEAAGGRALDPVDQINHFFDTRDGGLRRRRIGLRIRHESDRYRLTLKGPTASAEDPRLSERAELEVEIDRARAHAVLRGALPVSALLDLLDPSARRAGLESLLDEVHEVTAQAPLAHIGSFGNVRIPVETRLEVDGVAHPVRLEFDRTEFAPGDLRCEVELEVEEDAPVAGLGAALEALFERVGVTPVPTTSKLAYFQKVLDARQAAVRPEAPAGRAPG